LSEHLKRLLPSTGASETHSWRDRLNSKVREFSSMRQDFDESIQTLDDYLAACWAVPWAWGIMDCCHFGGGWVRAKTGRDPMAAFRYATPLDAMRIIKRGGGLHVLVDATMRSHGFKRTNSPEHGDLGVIATHGDVARVAGAAVVIFDGPWCVGREPDGLTYFEPKDVMAWRVA
jgi:hypothetical protein